MKVVLSDPRIVPFPRAPSSSPATDLRFRRLIGEEGWAKLPAAVRARFSKRLGGGRTVLYAGEIIECRMGRLGRVLAQCARLIGGPLPVACDVRVPTAVSVTEDAASGGQFWTRIYGRGRAFPQVIHSVKRFAGPTGLEEYIGCGIGIALRVEVEAAALHFVSDHYFLSVGGRRLGFPRWLEPGHMRVSHIDRNNGWFAFVLKVHHPLFGELVSQTALFREWVEAQ